jgi:hypothetical protein
MEERGLWMEYKIWLLVCFFILKYKKLALHREIVESSHSYKVTLTVA